MSIAEAHARLTGPGSPFEVETIPINGVPTRTWKNGPKTMRDMVAAGQMHGAKTFLVLDDDRVTFDAFVRAVAAFAEALVQRGVKKGDRVALVMRNLPEWPVVLFGSVVIGAIATPLNAWWTADELAFGLEDSGARILITDVERYERMQPILAGATALEHVIVARAPDVPIQATRLEYIIGRPSAWPSLPARPLPAVDIAPEDPATIFYTSGTTGKPKGALQSHRNSACNVSVTPCGAARNFLRRGEAIPVPDPNLQRATLLAVPFFHTTGCHAILCPSLCAGSKLVLMHRWDTERGMQLIEREKINAAGGVPTIAWQIIEHPNRSKYDLTSLEAVSYGGAPAASELVRRIKEVFPKSQPGIGWGMTETSATASGHSAEDYINRPESAGPASPINELRVVDDDWSDLPTGQVGELIVKGANVIAGYWKRPEANATLFRDGWFRTGDLAKLDEEGFLYVVDRKKDMLIRGGENIYCIEVEDALYKHPAIMDAAVVAIAHKTLGEEPGAVVTLKPGAHAEEAELKAFVAGQLAAFKIPVRVLFRNEPLPRNANGKILKSELKGLFG
jgi:long-chain acyl-CoA synthetase